MKLTRIDKTPGNHLSLFDFTYELPDGSPKHYEIAARELPKDFADGGIWPQSKIDGVCMVVTDPKNRKLLAVQEFRPAVNRWVWRLPEGMIEPGESAEDAARRELWEETSISCDAGFLGMPVAGYVNDAISCTRVQTMFGHADAVLHPFPGPAGPNPSEPITAKWLSVKEALALFHRDTPINTRLQWAILWFVKDAPVE